MDVLVSIYQHCSSKQKHINKRELVGNRGMDWEGERLHLSRNTDCTRVTCSSPFLQGPSAQCLLRNLRAECSKVKCIHL